MGGKYITAARLEDGRLVSFIDYTSTDFNLCFDQKTFLKIAKKHGLISIPQKNQNRFCYTFNENFEHIENILIRINLYNRALHDRDFKKVYYKDMKSKDIKHIFSENYYSHGFNSFLCPYWYGLNFFDFKNKKIFSMNNYADNTRYLLYTLRDLVIYYLSKEELEKDFIKYEYLFKLDELCNKGAKLISSDNKSHEISGMNAWQVLEAIRNKKFSFDSDYKVSLPQWDLFSMADFNSKEESINFLKQYLEDEKLLTEIDQIAWKLDDER